MTCEKYKSLDLAADLLWPGPRNPNLRPSLGGSCPERFGYLWLCGQTSVCSVAAYFFLLHSLAPKRAAPRSYKEGLPADGAKEHSKVFRWQQRTELSHLELLPGQVPQLDLRKNTSRLNTFFLPTSPLSPWNSIENICIFTGVCSLPLLLLLFFPFSWIWASLWYWGQVEVLLRPLSFRVFLGHEWSASGVMVYSLWASLVWFTRKVPVDTNCTVTKSYGLTACRLPAGLSCFPFPLHRELAGPTTHHTPCPKPTNTHTGFVADPARTSLREEIFPASLSALSVVEAISEIASQRPDKLLLPT